MDGTVTVASTDTLTEGDRQGVHPWMVHGWHSNCGIHRYFDRRWQPRCPFMDGHINCAIHGYLDIERGNGSQGVHLCMVHRWHSNGGIHGYFDRRW